jgi:hypothetical protein
MVPESAARNKKRILIVDGVCQKKITIKKLKKVMLVY